MQIAEAFCQSVGGKGVNFNAVSYTHLIMSNEEKYLLVEESIASSTFLKMSGAMLSSTSRYFSSLDMIRPSFPYRIGR